MTAAPIRVAIAGTDTGVGKTVVACGLVTALRARGLSVAAMKPAESGVAPGAADGDAARLARAAGGLDPLDLVCPFSYEEPLAPWVAASRVRRPVEMRTLDAARARLEAGRDALVVEGAGGLLAPYTRALTLAGLARRWALDVIVVAANRLGAINHTLLTVREATRRGLTVRAVALVAPESLGTAERTNVDALAALVGPVPLVVVPRLAHDDLDDADSLARLGAPLAELLTGAAVTSGA